MSIFLLSRPTDKQWAESHYEALQSRAELQIQLIIHHQTHQSINKHTHPPTMSFTMTLYETMMPITSFSTPSLILKEKKKTISTLQSTMNVTLLAVSPSVRSHARWCQVGVFVLQFAVQSDAPPLPVVGQQRQQRVDLLQGGSRRQRVPEPWRHTFNWGCANDFMIH